MIIDHFVQLQLQSVLKQAFDEHGATKLAQEIVMLLNEQSDFKLAYTLRDAINLHITNNS